MQSGCSLNQCVSRLAHVTYIVADNALFNMVLRWSTQALYQKNQYAYDASNTGVAAKKLQDSLTGENGENRGTENPYNQHCSKVDTPEYCHNLPFCSWVMVLNNGQKSAEHCDVTWSSPLALDLKCHLFIILSRWTLLRRAVMNSSIVYHYCK